MISWIINIVIAAALSAALGFVYNYDRRGKEITRLEHQLIERDNHIKVLEANNQLSKGTIESLNTRLAERLKDLDDACKLMKLVEESKNPDDDQPVGGIISTVLERMKNPKSNFTAKDAPTKKSAPAGKSRKD